MPAKALASIEDSCLAATMRSSNCFNGESWTTDSVITETTASLLRIGSVEQSQQSRLGFLWNREHFAEIGLGRSQCGLLGLL